MSDTATRFGERLRDARRRRGLTQDSLGESAGIHGKYVGELERGKKSPSLDVIERLAGALDVPPAELVGDPLQEMSGAALRQEIQLLSRTTPHHLLRTVVRILRDQPE